MRILNITHTAKPGGAEIALFNLVKQSRHKHIILMFETGKLSEWFQENGNSVHIVPVDPLNLRITRADILSHRMLHFMINILKIAEQLLETIKKVDPDVIHLNTIKSAVIYRFIKHKIDKPVIWHIRDNWTREYMSLIGSFALKLLSLSYKNRIYNSKYTLSTTRFLNRKGEQTLILPSPIDPNHCSWRYDVSSCGHVVNLLLIGRIAEWKGQETAIKALYHLPERYNLKIVGGALFGEDDYLEYLKSLVTKLKLEKRVQFLGHQENICKIYSTGDAVLHTSHVGEPFGQVIIEGLSHGLPVIASRIGAPSEIIVDRQNGILATPRNSIDLASKIVSLCSNKSLMRRVSNEGLLKSKMYTAEKIIDQFNDFLARVVR